MREIKLRAWDKRYKQMQVLDLSQRLVAEGLIVAGTSNKLQRNEDLSEWMQYTGLKDKNGVEIYEGDILSMAGSVTGAEGLNPGFFFDEDDKVEIAWDPDIAAWSIAGELDRTDRVEVTYRNHVIQLVHQGACEVIGNIYENPEMLEAKQ